MSGRGHIVVSKPSHDHPGKEGWGTGSKIYGCLNGALGRIYVLLVIK